MIQNGEKFEPPGYLETGGWDNFYANLCQRKRVAMFVSKNKFFNSMGFTMHKMKLKIGNCQIQMIVLPNLINELQELAHAFTSFTFHGEQNRSNLYRF